MINLSKSLAFLARFTIIILLSVQNTLANSADAIRRKQTILTVAVPGNVFARTDRGQPAGIVAEAVAEVLKRMGYSYEFVSMRAVDMFKALPEGKIDVATSLVRNKRALNIGLFTNPILVEYNVIAVRQGESFPLRSISDLFTKSVGVRTGYQYPLLEGNSKLDLRAFETDGATLRALIHGKIDAAVISGVSDVFAFRTEGIMNKVDILETAVGTVPIYAVLTTKRFSFKDILEFNQSLATLRKDQFWFDILGRNGLEDLVREWPLVSE